MCKERTLQVDDCSRRSSSLQPPGALVDGRLTTKPFPQHIFISVTRFINGFLFTDARVWNGAAVWPCAGVGPLSVPWFPHLRKEGAGTPIISE